MRCTRLAAVAATAFVVTAALTAPARAGDGSKLLRYLPGDARVIVSLDLPAMQTNNELARLIASAQSYAAAATAIGDLGVDFTACETMVIGTYQTPSSPTIAVLECRFDEKVLVKTFRTAAGKAGTHKHRGLEYFDHGAGQIGFVDHRLVIATSYDFKGVIDVAKGKAPSAAARTAAAGAMVASMAGTGDAWAVVSIDPTNPNGATQKMQGLATEGFGAAVRFAGQGITFEFRLFNSDETTASTMASTLRTGLSSATQNKAMSGLGLDSALASITVTQLGSAVAIAGAVSQAEIAAASQMFSLFQTMQAAPGQTQAVP
jgi:hypothetical protein